MSTGPHIPCSERLGWPALLLASRTSSSTWHQAWTLGAACRPGGGASAPTATLTLLRRFWPRVVYPPRHACLPGLFLLGAAVRYLQSRGRQVCGRNGGQGWRFTHSSGPQGVHPCSTRGTNVNARLPSARSGQGRGAGSCRVARGFRARQSRPIHPHHHPASTPAQVLVVRHHINHDPMQDPHWVALHPPGPLYGCQRPPQCDGAAGLGEAGPGSYVGPAPLASPGLPQTSVSLAASGATTHTYVMWTTTILRSCTPRLVPRHRRSDLVMAASKLQALS